jgi:hypothetical protein
VLEIGPRGNNNIFIIIFIVHAKCLYIFHARILLSENINTCVV